MTLKSCVKKKPKLILINLKVTSEELQLIRQKAKAFTKGNSSAWVRYAATQLSPRKKDLVK